MKWIQFFLVVIAVSSMFVLGSRTSVTLPVTQWSIQFRQGTQIMQLGELRWEGKPLVSSSYKFVLDRGTALDNPSISAWFIDFVDPRLSEAPGFYVQKNGVPISKNPNLFLRPLR